MSNSLRITGLASGLDVDSMVKQVMKAQTMKVDKTKQDRQIIQWKQDLYREMIGELNTFKSTYFDVLKPDTFMLSARNYSNFDIKSTDTNNTVSITTTAGAVAGDYRIAVDQIATKAIYQGTAAVNVKEAAAKIGFPIAIDSQNGILNVNGTVVSALSAKTYNNLYELASEINTKLSATTIEGGKLSDNVQAIVKNDKILFLNKINIVTDAGGTKNNELKLTVSGVDYKVDIEKAGKYSLNDIVGQINSKISGLKSMNESTTMTEGVHAELDDTGTSIIFKDKDGNNVAGVVTFIKDGALVATTKASVSSGEPIDPDKASTPIYNEVTNDNYLYYNKKILKGVNDTLNIKVGSTTRTVDLFDVNTDIEAAATTEDMVSAIAQDLNTKLAQDNVSVSVSADGKLLFKSATNNQITLSGNAATTLGLPAKFDINMSTEDRMSNLLNGEVKFTMNNVDFHYDFNSSTDVTVGEDKKIGAKYKTISDILNDISTKANVDITYSQLTRQFTLASKTTGADQVIKTTKDDSALTNKFLLTLFGKTDISGIDGTVTGSNPVQKLVGTDAKVTITEPNGAPTTIYRSTNSFTIDGVNYSINKLTPKVLNESGEQVASEITVTLTANPQQTFDKIKAFIDKYNEAIDKINDKITEKKQYSYLPLTDEQRKDMKEDEIKSWEEKAKQGLLKGDSTLENMLFDMRKAFFDNVKANYDDPDGSSIGISLSEIGLSTSNDITERGKIIIDEQKLKSALQNKNDKVMQLFTKMSLSEPSYNPDMGETRRGNRYKEEGIFQRINDILQDSLRTMRDSNGKKGILLEKAGIKGDFTEFHNLLTDELDKKDKIIKDLTRKLADKENYYYLQFSKLEQAMQKMNDQQSWFSQQMGAMNGGK